MAKLGVHVYEKATSVQTPKVATVGIPFVVGTAPVQSAAKPAKSNVPVLVTSWDEAVEKLGFSYDWESYTLCEFMYSHFQLFGCQPVIFCNVMDPARMKTEAAAAEYAVTDHVVRLPFSTLGDSIAVSLPDGEQDPEAPEGAGGGTALEYDEDYSVLYDENENACIVELLGSGSAYGAEKLLITCAEAAPDGGRPGGHCGGAGRCGRLPEPGGGLSPISSVPPAGPTTLSSRRSWPPSRRASWACSTANA